MKIDNYQNYSLEDFLADKHFKNWVREPNTEQNDFWENVQTTFPEKRELIAQARLLMLSFVVQEQAVTDEKLYASFDKLQIAKEFSPSNQKLGKQVFLNKNVYIYRIAVSLSLLMIVGVLVWYNYLRFEPMVYQTKYGQMQTIVLPDGSKVTLNANSRLEINSKWKDTESRRVNLVGEAYFEVEKKRTTNQKFIVHTADLDVVVLGTSFDVNSRNIKTQVVLKEGAITLKLHQQNNSNHQQEVVMQVGELVEFSKKDNKLLKKNVNTEKFSLWREHKLFFEDTPMKEIAQLIQENYGLKVSFEEETLASRKISGTLPNQNLQILLSSIETIFSVKITQQNDQLIFGK
ncbi:MAG: FecR domain-containing protein [Thermoflexibacter sp.]|jgi:ferric-dicitrate binding protein FerR (iron transport regulator)|nr:FecR domain-containing protein [Thermoflexibacter sp.]